MGSEITNSNVPPVGFHPSALPAALSNKVTLFIKLSLGFVDMTLLSAIFGVVMASSAKSVVLMIPSVIF
ncbi:MAG: hypothetical protein ACRD5B_03515 [Nitrososphaeraceae archaeon]